jgi:phosphomannomutase
MIDDRNGFKFFTGSDGARFTKQLLHDLGALAQECVTQLVDNDTVFVPDNEINCEHVLDWMPKYYAESLQQAILSKVTTDDRPNQQQPLSGLNIVLNAGNGSGGFFAHALHDLGATCLPNSLHLEPDGQFPNGVPNPESNDMVQETNTHCQTVQVDLGILLDTDADRCGFVTPSSSSSSDKKDSSSSYEPLNRNRLIALLSVIFAN